MELLPHLTFDVARCCRLDQHGMEEIHKIGDANGFDTLLIDETTIECRSGCQGHHSHRAERCDLHQHLDHEEAWGIVHSGVQV